MHREIRRVPSVLAPSVVALEGLPMGDKRFVFLPSGAIEIPEGPVPILVRGGVAGHAWCRRGDPRPDGAVPIEVYRGYTWIDREVPCGLEMDRVEVTVNPDDPEQNHIFTKARLAGIWAWENGEVPACGETSLKPREIFLEHT